MIRFAGYDVRIYQRHRIEIAKKLLKMGLTDAQIAEGTNLDVDTIEELRERYEQENQDNDD